MKAGVGITLLASALLAGWAVCGESSAAASKPPGESDRIKALPEEEREWLTEFVAPIIRPEERRVFLALEMLHQREEFKRDFWERREDPSLPRPLGPGYRIRYQELRRLVDEKYDGWRNDAGRLVIRHGEPAEVFQPRGCAGETFRDLEIWKYTNIGSSGRTTRRFLFFRQAPTAPRRLWSVNVPDSDVFLPNSCRQKLDALYGDCMPVLGDKCGSCPDRCDVYHAYLEIKFRQPSGAAAAVDEAQTYKPVEISTEGLDRLKDKWATTSDPNAKRLTVQGPLSAVPPDPEPTPDARRSLAREEIRERILGLEPEYRSWLDLATPLLTFEKLVNFLQSSGLEKDAFLKQFWKRRS